MFSSQDRGWSRQRGILLIVAAVLMFAACDTAEQEDADGFFNARVTGEFTQSLEGRAIFAPGSYLDASGENPLPMLGLQLQATSGEPLILIAIERIGSDARPAVGTYRAVPSRAHIEDVTKDLVVTYVRSQEDPFLYDVFSATGGTVEITASEEGRLAGRLQFAGDAGSGRRIEVQSTFDAVRGYVPTR